MDIRPTQTKDWRLLKQVRLAALQDAPTAFGVSYQSAARYSDQQWQERASGATSAFWLATGRSKAKPGDRIFAGPLSSPRKIPGSAPLPMTFRTNIVPPRKET